MGHASSKELSQSKSLILDGVVLLNDELGRGTYGLVFTVRYKGKLYAAKRLHSTLTDEISRDDREAVKNDFIRECLCYKAIKHPNIVQFLGMYYEKVYEFPVMVMELMNCSLSSFVKNNCFNVEKKVKMSILYDVSLGLSFLHGHEPQIIHGDLSSNNVMLTNHLVAKIGGLGVAKAIQACSKKTLSTQTQAPEVLDFMPPEILRGNDVVYTTPVDVFSIGCVALHIFSKTWPTPVPSKTAGDETNEPVVLTEAQRRKKYLDMMIGKGIVVLKNLIERCLSNDPNLRPTVEEMSDLVMQLHTTTSSNENMNNHNDNSPYSEHLVLDGGTSRFVNQPPSFTEALQSDHYHISWTPCANLPAPMHYISVAVSSNTIYVTGDSPNDEVEHNVYSYNTGTDCWQQLPQPGHCYGILCMVDDKVTIFGGRDSSTDVIHNKVTTYESDTNKWNSYYPDMLYVRSKPGVITYRDYVIVMGGGYDLHRDHNTIEVMNYIEKQWKLVPIRLPVPMYNITPTISGKLITIVGYSDYARHTACYRIPVKHIVSPKDMFSWKPLHSTAQYNTAIIPYSDPPVIVGGETQSLDCTSIIKMYCASTDSWQSISSLTSARDTLGVAYINEYTIIVMGGTSGGPVSIANCLTTVEIGHIIPTYIFHHKYIYVN